MSKKPSIDPIYAQLIDDQPVKTRIIERTQINENTEILIDSDNEDEFTSSGVSEDEDFEEEETEEHQCQEGNILQPIKSCPRRVNFNPQKVNVTIVQAENVIETTHINNDQLLAQTMAVLAAKYRHTKPKDSKFTKNDILSFVGPCPLYSLSSSFGLDMQHGLSYFPCRDILADGGGGGGHYPTPALWQHLTSYHNLNLSSSSQIISHLILHGYSAPTPTLFSPNQTKNILRTTPRYSLIKKCPLTRYGVYGIEFEHGTRLCSGLTYNTNIYSHLISFHKMTHDASLRLSRAIALHDRQFRFQSNDILVSELIQYPPLRICQIKANRRLLKTKQCHLSKEILANQQPVTIPSN